MRTYESGKAPQGAPVTWEPHLGSVAPIKIWRNADRYAITYAWTEEDADAICRAFHLASLAEEYAAAGDEADKTVSPGDAVFATLRWCRAASALREAASVQ